MSKYTVGPWYWVLNEESKGVSLVSSTHYQVMGFVRYGLQRAAPIFRDKKNIMERCDKFGAIVPGREHHASWFKDISHPDARLIAAAPDLYQALVAARDLIIDYQCNSESFIYDDVMQQIDAALAKVEG